MQRLIVTVIIAFVMSMVAGPFIIPWLKRLKVGQTINQFGPRSHAGKQGTATMGGIVFVLAATVATLITGSFKCAGGHYLIILLFTMLIFTAIGFVDDYLKVVKRRSEGLTPMQKIAMQLVVSVLIAVFAYNSPYIGSKLIVPFTQYEWDLGIFYIPVMTFVMIAVVNSANLLDGLDGLCAGCGMLDFGAFALIAMTFAVTEEGVNQDFYNTALFSAAMCGALLGFMRFNSYPAAVFMGDLGSFAIGGALVAIAIVTRLTLILPIIAFAMVISSLSDILQVLYVRFTKGRRLFRMAPLHHHFELSGIPETKIVTMYHVMTALLCLGVLIGFVK